MTWSEDSVIFVSLSRINEKVLFGAVYRVTLKMRLVLATLAIIICAISYVTAVDEWMFKKCNQSSFCRRCRYINENESPYVVLPTTLSIDGHMKVDIVNNENQQTFVLTLKALLDNSFHYEIDEKSPLKPR